MGYSKLLGIFFLFFSFSTFASSTSLNKIKKCSKEQSEDLLLFKLNLTSINDTFLDYECQDRLGSDYHPIMMSWNTNSDCCNWDGVTCDDSTGDVIGIDVSCGRLQGTIHLNTSLFNLPHLQTLNLAFNNFTGSQIPREIGRLSNSLTHLNLSYCEFSGQVPPEITLLQKLVSLDLSWNGLKLGPDVFINMFRNFTNLEQLSLDGVDISSVLPTTLNISSSLKLLNLFNTGLQGKLPHYFFNLHSLETLDLAYNSFTGDIPLEIPVNLTHLTYLDLSANKLNGTLPSWLFTSPSLEVLSLWGNMFSGNVPFESFALPSLKYLDLSNNNQLGGQIDVQTFPQLTNLTDLGLSFNNFSGELELDTLLSTLTNLDSLRLSYSGFSVTTKNANHYVNPDFRLLRLASCKLKVFPNSFRAMKQLVELDLSYNFITALPQFQWYGLEYLYLQSNLIEGPFPQSICNMRYLWYLDMSNNRFGGFVPQCFGNINSFLENMDLGTNQLQGPFPPSICNMSSLRYLDISNNRFGGSIPQCFGNIFSYINVIDMGNNSFQGTIPSLYNGCEWLRGLILKGNQLEGELPRSLSKCRILRVLDLGNNHLNGTFPSWLKGLPYLRVLVLKSNRFHGHIQPSHAVKFPFPSLQVLDVSHNRFVGQLPAKYFQNLNSMKNVVKSSTTPKYLSMAGKYYSFVVAVKGVNQDFPQISVDYTIIDMSNNTFDGHIPNVIGALSSLIVLKLSHNRLKGQIPHALGNLTEIESLDLSWNQLSGEIPQSLADNFHGTGSNVHNECRQLKGLMLNGNQLEGQVPHSLSKCRSLKVLDLGNNKLNGTFPVWLGGLSELQVLVLKSNNFHGPIEISTGMELAFASLQVLDLSHNGFVGKLPGILFQNFKAMQNMVSNSTEPEYLSMPGGYYSMIVVVKDVQLTFTKLLVDYTIFDLSDNRFEGEIPNTIGSLKSLKVLNLSHNNINGEIPNALGKLMGTESLDLSWNQLIGEIPQSLAEIKGLAVLNLSENHLVGRIPKGTQFNTFDESSFEGNLGLCGLPLTKKCSEHTQEAQLESHEVESGFTWEVVTLGYGCGTLLGLVIGYLMLSTRKVKWFNAIADAAESLVLKKRKRRHVYIGK